MPSFLFMHQVILTMMIFISVIIYNFWKTAGTSKKNKWQQIIELMQITDMQAEVQDGKYILLAILKGFLWVYT